MNGLDELRRAAHAFAENVGAAELLGYIEQGFVPPGGPFVYYKEAHAAARLVGPPAVALLRRIEDGAGLGRVILYLQTNGGNGGPSGPARYAAHIGKLAQAALGFNPDGSRTVGAFLRGDHGYEAYGGALGSQVAPLPQLGARAALGAR